MLCSRRLADDIQSTSSLRLNMMISHFRRPALDHFHNVNFGVGSVRFGGSIGVGKMNEIQDEGERNLAVY
jgi:hypothetical protein